jgi:hypothetical protein
MDLSSVPLAEVAPYLHSIYLNSGNAPRASLIRIICELEAASRASIVEIHQFDLIIAQSLESRPPDPPPKVDDEKNSAFKAVYLLLRLRQTLPDSILRALLSLYTQPKHMYRELIVASICEAALVAPARVAAVPEVGQFFVDLLFETGNPAILQLITYAVEKKHDFVRQKHFLSHLMTPFLQFETKSDCDQAIATLTTILRGWPGLLFFGIHAGLLRDLVLALPHSPVAVTKILTNLIGFSDHKSVLDGFHGVVWHTLRELDLVAELNRLSPIHPEVSASRNSIAPFVSASCDRVTPVSYSRAQSGCVYRLAPSRFLPENTAVSLSGFPMHDPIETWNWAVVFWFLSVALRSNTAELGTPLAKTFCTKLLDYFTTMDASSLFQEKIECLEAVIDLLLSNSAAWSVLEDNRKIKRVIEQAIMDLIAKRAPNWIFFNVLCQMLMSRPGSEILGKWKLVDAILTVGECCLDADICSEVFSRFWISPTGYLDVMFLSSFLHTSDPASFRITAGFVRKLLATLPNFELLVYQGVIVPRLHKLSARELPEILELLINLVYEILITNDACLAITAGDPKLHRNLASVSRPIQSLLFARPEALKWADLKAEIQYWLETGNREYVALFEAAIDQGRGPGILDFRVPPHLFGQLAKIAEGREKVLPVLKGMVDTLLNGDDDDRVPVLFALASFASQKVTHGELAKLRAFEAMLSLWDPASYARKGSLISALSLIPHSKHYAAVLSSSNWQMFRFGGHTAVFPCDLTLPDGEFESWNLPTISDAAGNEVKVLIKQLSSPISAKSAHAALVRMFAQSSDKFAQPQLASWAHEFIAKFAIPTELRALVAKVFGKTPLLEVPKCPTGDPAVSALVRAQICEFLRNPKADSFSQIKIPVIAPTDVTEANVCRGAVEVYIADQEFVNTVRMTKEAFYQLPPDKMNEIRKQLVTHSES